MPASEVEVASPSSATSQAPSPSHERHVRAARRSAAPAAASGAITAAPPSRRSPRGMPSRAARTAARSFGTIPPSNVPSSSRRRPRRPRSRRRRRRRRDAGDICERRGSAQRRGRRRGPRGLVGVDVERSLRQGRDDRDPSLPRARSDTSAGRLGQRLTDEAELGNMRRLEADLVAHEADGAAGRAPRRALRSPRRSDSRTTSSAAAPVTRRPSTNRTGRPRRSISAEICGPAPWTTHDVVPAGAEAERSPRPRRRRRRRRTSRRGGSRRVLRVDADVVVGEVGGEVARPRPSPRPRSSSIRQRGRRDVGLVARAARRRRRRSSR